MATKKATSFGVVCPLCHDADAVVRIDLNNMTECHCSGCDETFSPQQARDLAADVLRRWESVCRWIELAPTA